MELKEKQRVNYICANLISVHHATQTLLTHAYLKVTEQ
jgi:hypothetical protein